MTERGGLGAFGRELRRMRLEMGLTQEKLAERIGADPTEISRYERGRREMGALLYARFLALYESRRAARQEELLRQIAGLDPEEREFVARTIRFAARRAGEGRPAGLQRES